MIGLLADSHGDLAAFDAAYEVLRQRGARRFIFAGGSYRDLDDWLHLRSQRPRAFPDATLVREEQGRLLAPAHEPEAAAAGVEEEPARIRERFTRAPERGCREYLDPAVPRKLVELVGDTLCCVVHEKNDLSRDDLENAAVFIHGNASEPGLVQIGPRSFLTPGPLSGVAQRTCALLERFEGQLRFSAFSLEGQAVGEPRVLALERRSKVSVR
ncbi:MAG TPA: hypothetical protein VFO83_13045 [Aggregicoccus sp.]|nr:hypothetical protein [Aggregicoccus sp.]